MNNYVWKMLGSQWHAGTFERRAKGSWKYDPKKRELDLAMDAVCEVTPTGKKTGVSRFISRG